MVAYSFKRKSKAQHYLKYSEKSEKIKNNEIHKRIRKKKNKNSNIDRFLIGK